MMESDGVVETRVANRHLHADVRSRCDTAVGANLLYGGVVAPARASDEQQRIVELAVAEVPDAAVAEIAETESAFVSPAVKKTAPALATEKTLAACPASTQSSSSWVRLRATMLMASVPLFPSALQAATAPVPATEIRLRQPLLPPWQCSRLT
jgi:hypothetical protein